VGQMRILVNGYFYGGNCPPFVHTLKKINPDTKLTNSLGVLDDHGVNRDYLEKGDLIKMELNGLERLAVRILRKVHLGIWKKMLTHRARKIVSEYRPDLIINHKASDKAEIMLRTGFQPQLTYIYGSEVHGERVHRSELDYIFAQSAYILTTTQHMRSYLCKNRGRWQDKIRVFPMGNFDLGQIEKFNTLNRRDEVRRKNGFTADEMILLENRCLRGEHSGLEAIVGALRRLNAEGVQAKIIILKGIGGTAPMVKRLQRIMKQEPDLGRRIVFVNEIVDNDRLFAYYFLADAFVSLLPADQMGKCISDAMFFDCSLILSDLEVYRKRFGDGPCYIKDQNAEQLADTIISLVKGRTYKVEPDVYERLLSVSRPDVQFADLYSFIRGVIEETSCASGKTRDVDHGGSIVYQSKNQAIL
jgi:glycosyltransferase involved in cell wall biosynthesis